VAGEKVVVNDINPAGADQTVALIAASGAAAAVCAGDISDENDVARMVNAVTSESGTIDFACNNAIPAVEMQRIEDLDQAYARNLGDVILVGTAMCLKHELRDMRDHYLDRLGDRRRRRRAVARGERRPGQVDLTSPPARAPSPRTHPHRGTAPAHSMRSSRSAITLNSSTGPSRVRAEPRQKWGPKPKERALDIGHVCDDILPIEPDAVLDVVEEWNSP
jgi:NAD(P)-dependent dehydrogenase (short-subunit alcohol dehydrogenase family)